MSMTEPLPAQSDTDVNGHIGGQILRYRKLTGKTQMQLGELVACTYQQIQKYEKGKSRVSAAKLWQIAKALGVPVAVFFVGLE